MKAGSTLKRNSGKLIAAGVFGSLLCYMQRKGTDKTKDWIKIGLAGSLAQGISELSFHFIDTVNNRCKVNKGPTKSIPHLRKMIASEGYRCLFRGINVTFYTGFCGGLVYFALYKYIKDQMKGSSSRGFGQEYIRYFCAAFVSELATLFIYYPMEMIKTRMQVGQSYYRYNGLADALKKIIFNPEGGVNKGAIKSLYIGSLPYFCNFTLYTAVQFACYEGIIYSLLLTRHKIKPNWDADIHALSFVGIAAISGTIASLATNWIEVITVQRQINPSKNIIEYIKEEKTAVLIKGILPRLLYNVSQTLAVFTLLRYFCARRGVIFEG